MDETKVRQDCHWLMCRAVETVLTTIDSDGYPESRAMLNLRNQDQFSLLAPVFDKHPSDFLVYFSTNTSSRKVAQVCACPRACVFYCDPAEWEGLTIQGAVDIVEDPDVKESLWLDDWQQYYPGGAQDPDFTVLRFIPKRARYYHRLAKAAFSL